MGTPLGTVVAPGTVVPGLGILLLVPELSDPELLGRDLDPGVVVERGEVAGISLPEGEVVPESLAAPVAGFLSLMPRIGFFLPLIGLMLFFLVV